MPIETPRDNPDSPGQRIRLARIQRNLTIRELSVLTGLSTRAIVDLENGHKKPSLPTLRLLSQALDAPISYLENFEILSDATLVQKIQKARLYHGLTKEEFARRIGTNERTVRDWERNRHRPSAKHMEALKRYLSVLEEHMEHQGTQE